jgi:hypothetical protein
MPIIWWEIIWIDWWEEIKVKDDSILIMPVSESMIEKEKEIFFRWSRID